MSFVNLYEPPAPTTTTPSRPPSHEDGPIDINFGAPFPAAGLETALVKVAPFIASLHLQPILEDAKKQPGFFQWMPFAFDQPGVLDTWMEVEMRQDPTSIGLAIIDKTKPDAQHPEFGGSVAGIIGLYQTSFDNLVTEIGPVIITPTYQRSHVSVHAIGLVLRWCLELPSAGGLGLRRVVWTGNPQNAATIKVAKKMGLVEEGVMRWKWVIPSDKPGKKSRDGDPLPGMGRDSTMLAMCWDEWEVRGREHVARLMHDAEARLKQTA
ncbi:hypothetical protein HWV62_25583 [Athelia sp. TMB]|nr:hypothetical protein HWV62_25583 [Athelia sp. TMB]